MCYDVYIYNIHWSNLRITKVTFKNICQNQVKNYIQYDILLRFLKVIIFINSKIIKGLKCCYIV